MRRMWLAAIVVTFFLAGCTDDSAPADDGPPDDGEPDDTDAPAVNNTAPEATIATKADNVTIPGNVTLDLSGRDADGDALNWTLLLDETEIAAGDSLPAEHIQRLESAGNHTFRLVVDDGQATAEAQRTVLGIAIADVGPDPVHIELDIAMSCFHCYVTNVGAAPDNCLGLQQGENNQDCAWTEIDDAWRGRPFTTSGPFDVDVAWYSACEAGNEIETIGAEGHDTGEIHPDAGCMVLWDWDANPDAGTISVDIA